ncbi:hypothetical protein [Verminephrobacter eiseniae]|uniref:hypothetical protein n=1 Tax=Verminephrobacter eiseniae TaxID=364317 RepID=UPI0022371CFF|nr:hypothetical protein [Verminephrobacter eiseniae]
MLYQLLSGESMKKTSSLAVLKERLCLAAMSNCRAGGQRGIDMLALAQYVGVYREDCDLEKVLCTYIRDKIDARDARHFLIWMSARAGHADEPARPPPVGIPKTQQRAVELQVQG